MSVLQVQDLNASYRKNKVLHHVSFHVEQGSLTSIVGPNGAGKSTLLKVMLELHPKLSGNVSFFGSSLSKTKTRVGWQSRAADPWTGISRPMHWTLS